MGAVNGGQQRRRARLRALLSVAQSIHEQLTARRPPSYVRVGSPHCFVRLGLQHLGDTRHARPVHG